MAQEYKAFKLLSESEQKSLIEGHKKRLPHLDEEQIVSRLKRWRWKLRNGKFWVGKLTVA